MISELILRQSGLVRQSLRLQEGTMTGEAIYPPRWKTMLVHLEFLPLTSNVHFNRSTPVVFQTRGERVSGSGFVHDTSKSWAYGSWYQANPTDSRITVSNAAVAVDGEHSSRNDLTGKLDGKSRQEVASRSSGALARRSTTAHHQSVGRLDFNHLTIARITIRTSRQSLATYEHHGLVRRHKIRDLF